MNLIGLEAFQLQPRPFQIRLGRPRLAGNKFILEIQAEPGLPVSIQSSENLKDWETFSVQTLEEGVNRIALPIESAPRFYRVVASEE
jgi:hypothetical protein